MEGENILIGPRRSGKTYQMIERVKKSGGILVVTSERMKQHILESYDLKPSQVMSGQHPEQLRGTHNPVYVDDAEILLGFILGRDLTGLSLTGTKVKKLNVYLSQKTMDRLKEIAKLAEF